MAFAIGLLVFNISLNQNDYLLGKMTNGFTYVNEIETVVEFIVEVCITGQDTIPENQIPGGTLGFEEEEKHLHERPLDFRPIYIPNKLYKDLFAHYRDRKITSPAEEVITPPPQPDHSFASFERIKSCARPARA